ncbi:MAG TPA: flagellar motor switch phosphatase FliY, partial [Bacillota bacterium]|nr:flagellar motor switch phosphatase FliY [Bacillota bacterium]
EFHLGAVGEAMNQMMGSSCTSMSSVLGQRIEIGIPKVRTVHLANEALAQGADENETIIKVTFQMQVGNLINSEIMQILPVSLAKQLVADVMDNVGSSSPAPQASPAPQPGPEQVEPMVAAAQQANLPPLGAVPPQQGMYPPQGGYVQQGYPPQMGYIPQQGMVQPGYQPQQGFPPQQAMYQPPSPVNVQPAQFTSLSSGHQLQEHGNIGLIMDVPLQITVELGKTRKTIKEILELGPGSVLELDKLAGEPVDLLVNGKLVAKGEVVVIDENFGVRVTDIVSPIERVANLQ